MRRKYLTICCRCLWWILLFREMGTCESQPHQLSQAQYKTARVNAANTDGQQQSNKSNKLGEFGHHAELTVARSPNTDATTLLSLTVLDVALANIESVFTALSEPLSK